MYIYTTITSTEVLKGWRNVIRKQFKKLKSLLNLIRVTRTEEETLWWIQTRKLNKFWNNWKKKKIKNFIYDINHSEKLPQTN